MYILYCIAHVRGCSLHIYIAYVIRMIYWVAQD